MDKWSLKQQAIIGTFIVIGGSVGMALAGGYGEGGFLGFCGCIFGGLIGARISAAMT